MIPVCGLLGNSRFQDDSRTIVALVVSKTLVNDAAAVYAYFLLDSHNFIEQVVLF